jgi:hypothetical protein
VSGNGANSDSAIMRKAPGSRGIAVDPVSKALAQIDLTDAAENAIDSSIFFIIVPASLRVQRFGRVPAGASTMVDCLSSESSLAFISSFFRPAVSTSFTEDPAGAAVVSLIIAAKVACS